MYIYTYIYIYLHGYIYMFPKYESSKDHELNVKRDGRYHMGAVEATPGSIGRKQLESHISK